MKPNLDVLIEAVEQLGELADEVAVIVATATGIRIFRVG